MWDGTNRKIQRKVAPVFSQNEGGTSDLGTSDLGKFRGKNVYFLEWQGYGNIWPSAKADLTRLLAAD